MEPALVHEYLSTGLELLHGRSFKGYELSELVSLAAHTPSLTPVAMEDWGVNVVGWQGFIESEKPKVPDEPLAAVKHVKRAFIDHAESTQPTV